MGESLFNELMTELCKPFPDHVKKVRQDGRGTYIPIQHYIDRLNEVAGPHWSHERVGEPVFYTEDQFVHTQVNVTICGRSHHGEGFSRYQIDKKHGRIKNRHYAIRSATKDAIRDAISFFGMRRELNKQAASASTSSNTQSDTCIKCQKTLTIDEIHFLDENNIKFRYCMEHVPHHLKN